MTTAVLTHFWGKAQYRFNANATCRAGLSIAEWCAKSRTECCGICPQQPITGPGTIVSWAAGTFFNLIVVLAWTNEASYNLGLQIMNTNAAMIGLWTRASAGSLSEFHVGFVPLIVTSCIPLACAAALTPLPGLHGMSKGGAAGLGGRSAYFGPIKVPPGTVRAKTVKKSYSRSSRRSSSARHTAPNTVAPTPTIQQSRLGPKLDAASLQKLLTGQRREVKIPDEMRDSHVVQLFRLQFPAYLAHRKWLPNLVHFVFFLHIVFWSITFLYMYTFPLDFSQHQCNGTFNQKALRMQMGLIVFIFMFIASFVWWALGKGIKKRNTIATKPNAKKDEYTLNETMNIFPKLWHSSGITLNSKQETLIRSAFPLVLYFAWFGCFVGYHAVARTNFLLIGDDPLDFGQIGACCSILIPCVVAVRSFMENWDDALQTDMSTAKNFVQGVQQELTLSRLRRLEAENKQYAYNTELAGLDYLGKSQDEKNRTPAWRKPGFDPHKYFEERKRERREQPSGSTTAVSSTGGGGSPNLVHSRAASTRQRRHRYQSSTKEEEEDFERDARAAQRFVLRSDSSSSRRSSTLTGTPPVQQGERIHHHGH